MVDRRDGEAELPTPPWRRPRKTAPARRQLSQDLIVETGLRVLDAEGLDALSMRRVAQELDTGPASLYAHVANKEELLELIYDLVLGEVELPGPDPSRWQEQLRDFAMGVHEVLGNHADVARAALAGIPTGPNAVRLAEFAFGLLVGAGMAPKDASYTLDRLTLYISGDAYEGSLYYAKMRAVGLTDPAEYFRRFVGEVAAYFHALPPERFPYVTAHVDALTGGDGEERFRYGLELFIAGVAARMP